MGTIIGILATILIAVISSRLGKTPKVDINRPKPNHMEADETTYEEATLFEKLRRLANEENNEREYEPKTYNTPVQEVKQSQYESLESYVPSYSTLEVTNETSLEAFKPQNISLEQPRTTYQSIDKKKYSADDRSDCPAIERKAMYHFDVRKAVIYSEILQPKYKQY